MPQWYWYDIPQAREDEIRAGVSAVCPEAIFAVDKGSTVDRIAVGISLPPTGEGKADALAFLLGRFGYPREDIDAPPLG
jgi:hypothetical protein